MVRRYQFNKDSLSASGVRVSGGGGRDAVRGCHEVVTFPSESRGAKPAYSTVWNGFPVRGYGNPCLDFVRACSGSDG